MPLAGCLPACHHPRAQPVPLMPLMDWHDPAPNDAAQNAAVLPTLKQTYPIVYADWLHAGPDKPTVLVSRHSCLNGWHNGS